MLRGHLVPDAIHGQARRRKAALRSTRGSRVTWDDVMTEGVELLLGRSDLAGSVLEGPRRSDASAVRRRLVQATLPADLDKGLVDLQLDLGELSVEPVTYEELWAAAIGLWLESTA